MNNFFSFKDTYIREFDLEGEIKEKLDRKSDKEKEIE